MRARLGYLSILENKDLVTIVYRPQSMGDKDAGPFFLLQDAVDVVQQRLFRIRVESRRLWPSVCWMRDKEVQTYRFVKEEEPGILQKQPSHSQALLFTTGDHHSSLSHCSIVLVG